MTLLALTLATSCDKDDNGENKPGENTTQNNSSQNNTPPPNNTYPCFPAAALADARLTHERLPFSFQLPEGFEFEEAISVAPDVYFSKTVALSRQAPRTPDSVGLDRLYTVRLSTQGPLPQDFPRPGDNLEKYEYGTGGDDLSLQDAGEITISGQSVKLYRLASNLQSSLTLYVEKDGQPYKLGVMVTLRKKTPVTINDDEATCPKEFDDLAFAIARSIQIP
jgi:hypothetical protein